MPEVKTKALHDKLAEKFAEVKVETHVILLCQGKAEALMDTSPPRLTDVKIEIQRDSGSMIRRGVFSVNWLTN